MLDVLSLAEQDTTFNHKASTRRELKGPCPDPSCSRRRDGFSIKRDSKTGQWVFMCRGCWDSEEFLADRQRKRGWGDTIAYLMHYRKMPYRKAKALVDEQAAEGLNLVQPLDLPYSHQHGLSQEATEQTVQEYEARLWSDEGADCLDYIRSRGFTDKIIQAARMGYSTKDGIPRLIVPSQNEGKYVAIYRRDLRTDLPEDEPRWKDAPDSTKSELYLADFLRRRKPTVITESALDALSILQECGDIVNVVATGGVTGGRHVKWIAKLVSMPLVLVAFDSDKTGDKRASWWLERLPNARRLRPLLKDANAMLAQGWDIREWVESALSIDNYIIIIDPFDSAPTTCTTCHLDLNEHLDTNFHYDEQGQCYCEAHYGTFNNIKVSTEVEQPDETWDEMKGRVKREYERRFDPTKKTQDEYWAETRRYLTRVGYYEQVERDRRARQKRIEEYEQTYRNGQKSA